MRRFIAVFLVIWGLGGFRPISAQTLTTLGGIANDGGAFASFGGFDGNNEKLAQRFSGLAGIVVQVKVGLFKTNNPTDNAVITVRQGSPDGPVLGTPASVAGSALKTGSPEFFTLNVGPFQVFSGTSYYVVFSRSGAGDVRNLYVAARGTSGSVFGGVASGDCYFYRSGGWVSNNLANSFMVTLIGYPPPSPPAAPAELTATPAGNQIALAWTPNSEPSLAYYKIYRNQASGFTPSSADSIGRVLRPAASYADTGLAVGTYHYRLAAADSFGAIGSFSAQASATVSSAVAPPVLGALPASFSLDTVTVGSLGQRTLTLNNTGGGALSVSAVAIGGADAGQFSVSPSSASIAPGGNQNLTLTFSPASAGPKSASLTLTHNAAGGSSTVSLAGIGRAATVPPSPTPTPTPTPTALISSTALTMDTTSVGSFSQKTFMVSNTGVAGLTVSNVSRSGADSAMFAVSPVAFTVPVGGSQTVTVSFVPVSAGGKATILNVYHNAAGSPAQVVVSGVGKVSASPPPTAPAVALLDSLVMDSTGVGSSSQKTVGLTNTGTASLAVTSVIISGTDAAMFNVSPTSAALAVGASQGLSIRFAPISTGIKTAILVVSHNAPGSPDTIRVKGVGKAPPPSPSFSLAPTFLAMDSTLGGAASQKIFTISNSGTVTLNVTSVAIGGAHAARFSVLPTSAVIGAGGSQIFIVTFAPDSAGLKSAALVFSHNAAGSPDTLNVTGVGKSPPPVPTFGVSPAALTMDSTSVGSSSQRTLTISNSGTVTLNVTSVAIGGAHAARFSVLPTSAVIGAGGSQIFIVTFAPDSAGLKSAALVFSHNAAGGATTVTLSGIGRATSPAPPSPSPVIAVAPTPLILDSTNVGSFSQKTLTVSNTGAANLVVSNILRSGADSSQFAVSPSAFTVSPGGSQTVTVNFVPVTAAQKSTILNVLHNAAGSPTQVVVSGVGKSTVPPPPNNPAIAVASLLMLDSTYVGSSSQKMLPIFNTGTANLVISGIAVSGSDAAVFTVTPTTITLAPGSGQSVVVRFTPASAGDKSAVVTISHNANGGSTVVAARGVGTAVPPVPVPIAVVPGSFTLDSTTVGSFSQKTLTVSNAGTANLVISNITRSGGDSTQFSVSPSAFTVPAGGSASVTVNFAPVSTGPKNTVFGVVHNATGSPSQVAVSGWGREAPAVAAPPQSPRPSGPITVDLKASNTEGRGRLDTKFTVTVLPGDSPLRYIRIITGAGDTIRSGYDSYTYTRPGKYTVRAEVMTLDGQPYTVEKPNYITVWEIPPEVDFTAEPVSGQAPLTVRFRAVNTGGAISAYGWNFGDSTSTVAAADSVVHVYARAGTYGVGLVALGPAGSDTTIKSNLIVVSNPPPPSIPVMSVSVSSLKLDTVLVGGRASRFITVANTGNADLLLTAIGVSGSDSLAFTVSQTSAIIAAGGKQNIAVTFSPRSAGLKSATLFFKHNASGNPSTIALSGVGLASADFTGDGMVTLDDFFLFSEHFGEKKSGAAYDSKFDLDGDGEIGFSDFFIFVSVYGEPLPWPK